jgi:uncharacterized protein with HEPN domain
LPSNKLARRLSDIVENADLAGSYIAGFQEKAFLADRKTQDAVERCLQRITEAAIKLGSEAERLVPGYPWKDIRGLGNRLRHEYDSIDAVQIWQIVSTELPLLAEKCEEALKALIAGT